MVAGIVASELGIALAYTLIPIALLIVLHRRKMKFGYLVAMFATFIFACGLSHLIDVIMLWFPYYKVMLVERVITAVVSLITAIVCFFLIDKICAIPTIQAHNNAMEALKWYRERESWMQFGRPKPDNEKLN